MEEKVREPGLFPQGKRRVVVWCGGDLKAAGGPLGFPLPLRHPRWTTFSQQLHGSQKGVRMTASLTWGSVPFTNAGISALE